MLLAKCLTFSLTALYLYYTDCLFNFQLLCRNICNLGILCNENLDFVKTRTKEADLCSYCNYNNNVPQHLFKEEFLPLQNLHKNKDIFIQILMKVILL